MLVWARNEKAAEAAAGDVSARGDAVSLSELSVIKPTLACYHDTVHTAPLIMNSMIFAKTHESLLSGLTRPASRSWIAAILARGRVVVDSAGAMCSARRGRLGQVRSAGLIEPSSLIELPARFARHRPSSLTADEIVVADSPRGRSGCGDCEECVVSADLSDAR